MLLEQIGHWQGFQALVSMILSCTAIPGHYPVDETSSSLTLTFWYTLQVGEDMGRFETKDGLLSTSFVIAGGLLHNASCCLCIVTQC